MVLLQKNLKIINIIKYRRWHGNWHSRKIFHFVTFLSHIFLCHTFGRYLVTKMSHFRHTIIFFCENYSIIILGFCFKGAWIFVTCSLSLLLICVTKSQWRQAKTGFFVCFTLTWVINLLRITALKSQNSHWCLNIFKWTASMCSFNFPLNWYRASPEKKKNKKSKYVNI